MKVVNLFAGHGTWTKPFRERGHDVWATDIVDRPGIDHVADILDLKPWDIPDEFWAPDVLLASPDCQAFSVASIGTHWGGGPRGYEPKTEKAINRMKLVLKTREIIEWIGPEYFVIENPRGMLRKLGLLDHYTTFGPFDTDVVVPIERRTVWYCQYGDERAKPTDLWGGFPPSLVLRPECKNGNPDHTAAPRGAKTGTQGREKDARSFIPYELALDVCLAVEKDIEESSVDGYAAFFHYLGHVKGPDGRCVKCARTA